MLFLFYLCRVNQQWVMSYSELVFPSLFLFPCILSDMPTSLHENTNKQKASVGRDEEYGHFGFKNNRSVAPVIHCHTSSAATETSQVKKRTD